MNVSQGGSLGAKGSKEYEGRERCKCAKGLKRRAQKGMKVAKGFERLKAQNLGFCKGCEGHKGTKTRFLCPHCC